MSYQRVKDKLYHGHRKIANNTYLSLEHYNTFPHEEWIAMRLHGNLVAAFHPDKLYLYSADWYTLTTKSRLNLALELAGLPYQNSIYQKDWEWYYDGNPVAEFKEGMRINYDGTLAV